MGFHNVRLPTNQSEGSSFGPGGSVSIIELQSGADQAFTRWAGAGKRRYNLAHAVRKPADLATIRDFMIARNFAANTWRLKDHEDYATSATGTTHNPTDVAVTNADVTIATGDGATKSFQLFKKYTSGNQTVNRVIELPVESTVTVAVNAVAQTLGVDYTVNDTDGTILFGTAPADTLEITAGFEFDVKARFGHESSASLDIDLAEFNLGSISSIDVIEVLPGELADPEMAWHGGAKDHGTLGTDVIITLAQGRVHRISTTAALDLILPAETGIADGGPIFAIKNAGGTHAITVKYADTTTTATTVAAGAFAELWLILGAGGLKEWQSK